MTVQTAVSAKEIEDAFLTLQPIVKQTPLERDHYLSLKYD
ncbi:hypothetical protein, partial [Staphylococcus condimenti]